MRKRKCSINSLTFKLYLSLLALCLISSTLAACTAICYKAGDQILFAKNYDWMIDDGYVMVNKRSIHKVALVPITREEPARWVSRYGSVTFNQYGRDLPIGGMNEKGLAIEALVDFSARYPKADERKAVNELNWVQYCLDTCANIREVIDAQKKIRISPQFNVPLHFMVSDAQNNSIAVEYVNGKTVCSSMDQAATKILTNSNYTSCLNGLKEYEGFGGTEKITNNIDRFIRIADRFKKINPGNSSDNRKNIAYGIATLQTALFYNTQWQIIYDLTNRDIYFRRTSQPNGQWQTINCKKLSYKPDTPVTILDIKKTNGGNVTKDFTNYTQEQNTQMVVRNMKRTPATRFAPDYIVKQIAKYPENTFSDPNPVAPGAKLKQVPGKYQFTEGPASDHHGNIFFTDIPANRIYKWTGNLKDQPVPFMENSGGTNGLFFDKYGNLLACQGKKFRVISIDPNSNVTVLADKYKDQKFNQPNDLWPDPKGGIYFTDPYYGRDRENVKDGEHVYYITPDRKNVIRVVNDMVRPNGLIGTPDGRKLYITDNGGKKTWSYKINPDGTLTNKKLFNNIGSDGMTIDNRGNIYLTDKVVHIYSPTGQKISEIKTPQSPSNVTFAGKDQKTLVITARTGVYTIPMTSHGVLPYTPVVSDK